MGYIMAGLTDIAGTVSRVAEIWAIFVGLGYVERAYDSQRRAAHHVHHVVVRLLLQAQDRLAAEGIPYTEVDIESDPAAAEFVMSVNRGNQTVPTVKFADGSTLTNPSARDVKAKLR